MASMEGMGIYRVLVGKPEEKRPLASPMRRWDDNIKWIFNEQDGYYKNWIDLAHFRDKCWDF
jgi:hypothetical protein